MSYESRSRCKERQITPCGICPLMFKCPYIWGTDYLDIPFVGMPCVDGDILANDWEEVEG